MLKRHMCSGRPVVADCMRANWSGVCVPSPSGSSASLYSSPAFFIICMRSAMGISRSTSRARWAWRMSRWMRPPLARPTSATASPVAKWTTLSTSRLLYGSPQRRTGMWIMGGFPFRRSVVDSAGTRAVRAPSGVGFAQGRGRRFRVIELLGVAAFVVRTVHGGPDIKQDFESPGPRGTGISGTRSRTENGQTSRRRHAVARRRQDVIIRGRQAEPLRRRPNPGPEQIDLHKVEPAGNDLVRA